jgi:leucine dehydrogenase
MHIKKQSTNKSTNASYEKDPFNYITDTDIEKIYLKHDKTTGLKAIIAINSTIKGPALGGCRCIPYNSSFDAILDAIKLSKAMTLKAALVDIPIGGGKSVIINNENFIDRTKCFKVFGKFIQSLKGKYIVGIDCGTTVKDMDTIATQTSYVSCTSKMTGFTSFHTAMGIYEGMKASAKHLYNVDNLKGFHIAIQGVGDVGFFLCELLTKAGAKLTITDINKNNLNKCKQAFNTDVVSPESIYRVKCDIFSPCALGGTLNDETIKTLQTKIIAGGANNQLAHPKLSNALLNNNIFYAPDYVINSGGLIFATINYLYKNNPKNSEKINNLIKNIYNIITEIYKTQKLTQKPSDIIANEMAIKKLSFKQTNNNE